MCIGINKAIPMDIRVIAATNRDMRGMLESGTFREDLYYHMSVLMLEIPPFSERRDNIPLLAKYFLHTRAFELALSVDGISQDAIDLLSSMEYSGNIRELNNIVGRSMVLSPEPVIGVETVQNVLGATAEKKPAASSLSETATLTEREAIIKA